MISPTKAFIVIAMTAAPTWVASAETDLTPFCGAEGLPTMSAAKVIGEGKVFFVENAATCDKSKGACPVCPSEAPACASKSYVVPGNVVFTGSAHKGYRCVMFVTARGASTMGYVPENRIETLPLPSPRLEDWKGRWKAGPSTTIDLKIKGDRLVAEGDAFWKGQSTTNVGSMAGEAAPKGNRVTFEDDQGICRVTLAFYPPYLLSEDNDGCGGFNVSFTGVFLRKSAGKARR